MLLLMLLVLLVSDSGDGGSRSSGGVCRIRTVLYGARNKLSTRVALFQCRCVLDRFEMCPDIRQLWLSAIVS